MLNIKRQAGFIAAVVPYLIAGGVAVAITAAGSLISNPGQSIQGLYFAGTGVTPSTNLTDTTNGGTYVHLSTTSAIPLSPQEQSSGWTSSPTGLNPPSVGQKNYGAGSFSFSASTLCQIPFGSVVSDSTGQYAYTAGPAYPSNDIPTIFGSNVAAQWINTGSTCNNAQGQPQFRTYMMSSPCQAGYTYNTSTKSCNLSNATSAIKPSDGICKMYRSGTSFLANATDPDCSDLNIAPYLTNGASTINLNDPQNPRRGSSVSIDTAGRVTITSQEPNANTNTNTTTTVVAAPSTSASGVSSLVVTGSMTTTTTGMGSLSTPASSSANSTGGLTASDLPKDYARQSDVQSTTAAVDRLNGTLTSATAPPDRPFDLTKFTDYTTGLEGVVKTFKDGLTQLPTNLFSYTLPVTLSAISCVPYTDFKIMDRQIIIDYCRWIELFRAYFGILLWLLTPFALYSIFLGAMGVYVQRGPEEAAPAPVDPNSGGSMRF